MIFNRADLSRLTVDIGRFLSEKRYSHTFATAKCAYYLGSLCKSSELDIILTYWATANTHLTDYTAKAKEIILHFVFL